MTITLDSNLLFLLFFALLVVMVIQLYMMMRVRNVLQAISMNFDSVIYFCRKLANSAQPEEKKAVDESCKTCKMCRHRLAYINTSKANEKEEDFYFKCALQNINITLEDSCERFEEDPEDPSSN